MVLPVVLAVTNLFSRGIMACLPVCDDGGDVADDGVALYWNHANHGSLLQHGYSADTPAIRTATGLADAASSSCNSNLIGINRFIGTLMSLCL